MPESHPPVRSNLPFAQAIAYVSVCTRKPPQRLTVRDLAHVRADAVRNYLVSLGVKPDAIVAQGRGEARPVASNDTPEGRANNRRVEIVIGGNRPASTATPTAAPR